MSFPAHRPHVATRPFPVVRGVRVLQDHNNFLKSLRVSKNVSPCTLQDRLMQCPNFRYWLKGRQMPVLVPNNMIRIHACISHVMIETRLTVLGLSPRRSYRYLICLNLECPGVTHKFVAICLLKHSVHTLRELHKCRTSFLTIE